MEVNGWNENVSTLQSNQDHSDVKTTETQTVAGIIWLMCRVEGEFGRLLRRQFRRWWRFVLFCNSDPSKQLVTKTQRKGSCPLIDSMIKQEIIVCVWLLQDRWRGDMVLVVWSYSLWIFILFIVGIKSLLFSVAFHWLDFCFLFRLYPVCSQFNIIFKKIFDCIAIWFTFSADDPFYIKIFIFSEKQLKS